MPRIEPVTAPFDDVAGPLLTKMMPGGADPIGLFRTFVRNPTMSAAMHLHDSLRQPTSPVRFARNHQAGRRQRWQPR